MNNALDVINKALDNFSKTNYALKFGKQVAKLNVIGFDVQQNIQSYDFYTPNGNYSQSWSTSPFLSTKDRFYDDKSGNIIVYQVNGNKMMQDVEPVTLDYDSFILKYGKLPIRKYLVENRFLSKDYLVHDHFLSFDNKDIQNKNDNSRIVFGSIIYDLREEVIEKSDIVTLDDGFYKVSFDLDVRYALDYYATQMLNTGSLYEYPKFKASHIEFIVDKNFNIVSCNCHDEFNSKTGFISAKVSMDSSLVFLTSDSSEFIYNGKKVKLEIPKANSPFNGSELFEN